MTATGEPRDTMGRMPRKDSARLERDVAAALVRPRRGAGSRGPRKPKKSARELRIERLKSLQHRMADAIGDDGWMETNPTELESWIGVDEELSNHDWLEEASRQLLDQSVLPEHAGAPPANVRAWNDVFIATYLMNVDDGMGREDAIDSARQNAHDTVHLESSEHGLERTDPDLYPARRWW